MELPLLRGRATIQHRAHRLDVLFDRNHVSMTTEASCEVVGLAGARVAATGKNSKQALANLLAALDTLEIWNHVETTVGGT